MQRQDRGAIQPAEGVLRIPVREDDHEKIEEKEESGGGEEDKKGEAGESEEADRT